MRSGRFDITFLANANFRGGAQRFGIRQADRFSHLYVIGKTGTGKSMFLKSMILQDIGSGRACAVFDPHGDLVADLVDCFPRGRRGDLVLLDATQADWTFNPLADIPAGHEALAVAEIVDVLRRLWADEWGPRLEHLVRNVLFTLVEWPNATLLDAMQLLTDREFRNALVAHVSNDVVRDFWRKEYERYSPAFRAVVIAPLQNKLAAFLTDPRLRVILSSPTSSFQLRVAMESGKVILVNLSRGQIGDGPSALLGAFLLARMGLEGLARARQPGVMRRDFHIYADEFQTFATASLATMLSELRKYRVSLTLANQFLGQLDPVVAGAVLGNVGTLVCFRVSADDADRLSRELASVFEPRDLVQLPNRHIYLRLMIDGQPSRPFSAETISLASYPFTSERTLLSVSPGVVAVIKED